MNFPFPDIETAVSTVQALTEMVKLLPVEQVVDPANPPAPVSMEELYFSLEVLKKTIEEQQ